jgi:hypothetical protein
MFINELDKNIVGYSWHEFAEQKPSGLKILLNSTILEKQKMR